MPGQRASEEQRREQILAAAFAVAARDRLDGLTIRRVASHAGLSPGLVFFHFGSKDELLVALLDRVIASTIDTVVPDEVWALPTAHDRLRARLRGELERLPERRDGVELFFDYWVMGTRHPTVRARIVAALAAYRHSFLPLVEDLVAEDQVRFAATTPARLAAVVVSLVEGTAVQAVMEPGSIDVEGFMATVESLIAGPSAPAGAPRGAGRVSGRQP